MVSERQKSKKKPRTYGDWREMLKEKDLDIVLVGSPDHWHALHAIAAMESGADVYCQKPISRDVLEGEAMLDAARRLKRIVQIGTQRKSTPHLIEARDTILKEGKLGCLPWLSYFYIFTVVAYSLSSGPKNNVKFDSHSTEPALISLIN